MKVLLKTISILGLLLTILPAFLVFLGQIELPQHKIMMLGGTVLWFITSPFWMNKKKAL